MIKNWPASHSPRLPIIMLSFAIAAYTVFFSWFSIARAKNFNAGWYDLGIMTQTVWRAGHGYGFTFTNPEAGPGGVHGWDSPRTAIHADYLLIFLTPLSWFGHTMELLLIVQTAVIAAGAWFLYRITTMVLKRPWIGLVMAGAYLLYPPLHFANVYDWHAVTLAITFILAAAEAIVSKRQRWFWVWFGLALIAKEQVGLTLGILTGVLWWWRGQRRLALVSLGVAWGWALTQLLVIIPLSRPELPASFTVVKFYASAGSSWGEILRSLASPANLADRLLTRVHLHSLAQLLVPLGVIFPVAGILAAIAIPEMLIYWLSDSPNQQTLMMHYHTLAIPYLFLSTIAGWWLINKLVGRFRPSARTVVNVVMAVILALGTVQATRLWSIWPWSPVTRWPLVAWQERLKPEVTEALSKIPATAAVGVTQNLGPLVAARPVVQILPNGIYYVDYIAILERKFDPAVATNDKRLAEQVMLERLKGWIATQPEAWQVIYQIDRVMVAKRVGQPTEPEPVWPDNLLGR